MDFRRKVKARMEKKTEIKVGEEVGKLVEKEEKARDKNRMKTGIAEEEMMVNEEVGNMADKTDQDEGEGEVVAGQRRKLNQDQQAREKGDEVKEYPCPNCYNMFPGVEVLTNHFKNCYAVNSGFNASNEVADELKGGVSKKVDQDRKAGDLRDKFPCHQCGKIFYSMVGLGIHNSKYCKEDIDKEEVEMMEDESSDPTWEISTKKDRPKVKMFKCPDSDCKTKMKSKSALKQHIDIVHGNKAIKCPESDCNAKLKSKSTLKQHIDFVHGDRRFPCKVLSCKRR